MRLINREKDIYREIYKEIFVQSFESVSKNATIFYVEKKLIYFFDISKIMLNT